MIKRDVVRLAFEGNAVPYVPWNCGFTQEAAAKLAEHFGTRDLDGMMDNHFLGLGSGIGFFSDLGDGYLRDIFGVVWNRSVDKDIGVVEGRVLPDPTLKGYVFPDPLSDFFFTGIEERISAYADRFRVFSIGFSLFERAWTMRGMEELLMDFIERPEFVAELFDAIADYNIAQVKKALTYDIDCVHLGDDWGQQSGLIMGPRLWRELIKPVLRRMYAVVLDEGKYVSIHSCGDVDEIFDDLVDIGLRCFNPFQPEVMDVEALMEEYHGRLAFHGGMSTQKTLPYGTVDEVGRETRRLLKLGARGGYVFAPAHSVEGDVPLENMLAFIEELHAQPAYASMRAQRARAGTRPLAGAHSNSSR